MGPDTAAGQPPLIPDDADMRTVAVAWPRLPAAVRAAILILTSSPTPSVGKGN